MCVCVCVCVCVFTGVRRTDKRTCSEYDIKMHPVVKIDLKAAQLNVKHSLNWDFILYDFEQDHNAMESIKKHFFCER